MPITRHGMYRIMDNVYEGIKALREQTQAAYAPNPMDPFENFKTGAAELEISKEEDLFLNKAYKHVVGIKTWVRSGPEDRIKANAREPIEKRIDDLINYLFILRAMIEEEKLDGISADSTEDAIQAGLMVLGEHGDETGD